MLIMGSQAGTCTRNRAKQLHADLDDVSLQYHGISVIRAPNRDQRADLFRCS